MTSTINDDTKSNNPKDNSSIRTDNDIIDKNDLISLFSDLAGALNSAMPAWNEPKMVAAKFRFWIAVVVILALWSLIVIALFTNHDQIVRDLVIAMASFLGGFASSRSRASE